MLKYIFRTVPRIKCLYCDNENFGRDVSKIDRTTNNILTKNIKNTSSSSTPEVNNTEENPNGNGVGDSSVNASLSSNDTDFDLYDDDVTILCGSFSND